MQRFRRAKSNEQRYYLDGRFKKFLDGLFKLLKALIGVKKSVPFDGCNISRDPNSAKVSLA